MTAFFFWWTCGVCWKSFCFNWDFWFISQSLRFIFFYFLLIFLIEVEAVLCLLFFLLRWILFSTKKLVFCIYCSQKSTYLTFSLSHEHFGLEGLHFIEKFYKTEIISTKVLRVLTILQFWKQGNNFHFKVPRRTNKLLFKAKNSESTFYFNGLFQWLFLNPIFLF